MIRVFKLGSAALCAAILFAPIAAGAATSDAWQFEASLYGYFPTIDGATTFPPQNGGSNISVDPSTILDNLKMVFMGSFEARQGLWGVYTDLLYMDVGNSKGASRDITIGRVELPAGASANVDLDIKTTGWELAGTYRAISVPDYALDVVFGTRVLDLREKLTWQLSGNVGSIALPDRAGTQEASLTNWDAIVGVKGRAGFGGAHEWFMPYYLDFGTGGSHFTWQGMVGVGYAFKWGDVLANWRYIDYRMKSGDGIERLTLNGPSIAVAFRW